MEIIRCRGCRLESKSRGEESRVLARLVRLYRSLLRDEISFVKVPSSACTLVACCNKKFPRLRHLIGNLPYFGWTVIHHRLYYVRITVGKTLLAPGLTGLAPAPLVSESIIVLRKRCDYKVLGFVKHSARFRITELLTDES